MDEPKITEHEIPDASPTRNVNPLQFFAPGGDPVTTNDFRPSTFVFKNDDDTDEDGETEDGHGNMKQANSRQATHPSQNRRRLPGREQIQQELSFDPDLVPDPTGAPRSPEEQSQHPAGSEEPKHAPGITGSKQNQPEQE